MATMGQERTSYANGRAPDHVAVLIAAVALDSIQKPADHAFATAGARI